ncbi:TetR/AcrR family transcriptional regulator [Streptomyces sp. NPDC090025]|uniref:TetR/AcrR family transcriptional regulator n=1 Tax=Streptomyces sp. NPDC090025 TaxID=3365922 RepID=UPI003833A356
MRADARRNRERLLAEARAAFAAHGTDASLEDIARRAGVGIGTLYRHFPTREALLGAIVRDGIAALLDRSAELAGARDPGAALVDWLRTLIAHAGEYRGLSIALMSTSYDRSSALAECGEPLRAAGTRLLDRARESGAVRADVAIGDLMKLTHAIALAAERAPEDEELAARLLDLTVRGLGPRPEESRQGELRQGPVTGPATGSTTGPATAGPATAGPATAADSDA